MAAPSISDKILAFNKALLPNIVQMKYNMMSQNTYCFFRATCHLYYEAFSKEGSVPFSPAVWACGDLHMENFGSYKGDNRLVYFDMNDFDEAILIPASWELVRFVSCIFIAFETVGLPKENAQNMAEVFLKTYSRVLANGKSFYTEPQTAKGIVRTFLNKVSKRKEKTLLKRFTKNKKGQRVINTDQKRLPVEKKLKKELLQHITAWIANSNGKPRHFEAVDVAFRVAGLGSLGLKRYIFLLRSTDDKEQYMLLDMKQSRISSLHPYTHMPQPAWETESERIIAVQHRMQNITPALLSSTIFKGDPFVIQELQPMEDSISLDQVRDRYRDLYQVINDMAVLTASAQLRSSGRQGSANADELILFGQNQTWQEPLIKLATRHAQKTRDNYKQFCKAHKQGFFEK